MIHSIILPRLTLAISSLVLAACAGPKKFQNEAASPNTAEVVVLFDVSSSRSVLFGGVFEDGRACRNYLMINVDGRSTPRHEMRVKPETLSMLLYSAGEFSGSVFGYGGWTGRRCGGTYSFDPKAGARYEVGFHDEPSQCGVTLVEVVNGTKRNMSHKIVKRDADLSMTGSSRCADTYVPQ